MIARAALAVTLLALVDARVVRADDATRSLTLDEALATARAHTKN